MPSTNAAAALQQAPDFARTLLSAERSVGLLSQVRGMLHLACLDAVEAGSLNEGTWTLLAANAATAAKLRQSLPDVLAAAQTQVDGLQQVRIQIATAH